MDELDPRSLEMIARALESMPAESRALVYEVIPDLPRQPDRATIGESDRVLSTGAEHGISSELPLETFASSEPLGSRSSAALEARVRMATSDFDFTTLMAGTRPAVLESLVNSDPIPETEDGRPTPDATDAESTRVRESPLLAALPKQEVETVPTFTTAISPKQVKPESGDTNRPGVMTRPVRFAVVVMVALAIVLWLFPWRGPSSSSKRPIVGQASSPRALSGITATAPNQQPEDIQTTPQATEAFVPGSQVRPTNPDRSKQPTAASESPREKIRRRTPLKSAIGTDRTGARRGRSLRPTDSGFDRSVNELINQIP